MITAGTTNRVRILPGNLQSSPAVERWVGRRLAGVLRRFGRRLTGIDVFFEDLNGPRRGGAGIRCVMEARVNHRPPLAVQARSGDLYTAIGGASRKLGVAVSRAVGRATSRHRRRPATISQGGRAAQAGPALEQVAPPQATSATRSRPAESAAVAPSAPASERSGPARRGHVIIAGYGPVGRALASGLARGGVAMTIIDANPKTVRTQAALGHDVIGGDATNPDVLWAAGIEQAAALAVTIPDAQATVRVCRLARDLAPGVIVVARAGFASEGLAALQAGANSVTVEEIATAHAMADAVRSLFMRDAPRGSEGAD
jgi:hypothetical protein